ncbi:MAG: tRNA (adenosine(37)-N6)-dimethylallyltransferase MiaA [Chromatiales bacterium]
MAAPARQMRPVIFLMGPTCAGKTAVAIDLVQALPCDIISVDSAMVYRGMDIGTAKPAAAELARAPHRLIDIRDPGQSYSAAEFRADAVAAIAEIQACARIPLLVGGTGLYFRALERGLSSMPAAHAAVRARLGAQAAVQGWAALHGRLAAVDPAAAARIHPNDSQRIQRALEIHELTGKGMTQWWREGSSGRFPNPIVKLALSPADRGELYRRAGERFRGMLAGGLIEEVRALRDRGDLCAGLASMRVVGYRQVWRYLSGECDRVTMVTEAIAATRQLAKRQLTWLRTEPVVDWIDASQLDLAGVVIRTLQKKLDASAAV